MNAIGQPVARVDGRLKVTGGARYTADLALAGTAHAAIVRYALVLIGAVTTLIVTLVLFGVPVGQLLLGVGQVRYQLVGRQRLQAALPAHMIDRRVLAHHDQPGRRETRRYMDRASRRCRSKNRSWRHA